MWCARAGEFQLAHVKATSILLFCVHVPLDPRWYHAVYLFSLPTGCLSDVRSGEISYTLNEKESGVAFVVENNNNKPAAAAQGSGNGNGTTTNNILLFPALAVTEDPFLFFSFVFAWNLIYS